MGLTLEEKRAALRSFEALSTLSEGDLGALVASLRWHELFKGEVLFRQGDYGDAMVLVAQGAFSVRVSQASVESEIRTVRAGETLGEMSCIDPAPRSATLVAIEPSVVAELRRDALQALRDGAPTLASRLIGMVLRDVTQRLRDVNQRIASELGEAPAATAPASARPTTSKPPPEASSPSRGTGLLGLLDRLRGRL